MEVFYKLISLFNLSNDYTNDSFSLLRSVILLSKSAFLLEFSSILYSNWVLYSLSSTVLSSRVLFSVVFSSI